MGIDVEHHLRVRVPEAVADDLDRHPGREQLRGVRMPEVVEPDVREPGGPEEGLEMASGALTQLVVRSAQDRAYIRGKTTAPPDGGAVVLLAHEERLEPPTR